MSTTRETNVSLSNSNQSGNPDDGEYSQSTFSAENSTYLGSLEGDDDVLGAMVMGDASAVGTDTFAGIDAEAAVTDGSYTDSLSASVDATAIAESGDGSSFTTANAAIEVIGSADVFFGTSQTSTSTVVNESGSVSVSETSIDVNALSFSDGSVPEESDVGMVSELEPMSDPVELGTSEPYIVETDACDCYDEGDHSFDIDGNLAAFDIQATASGDDSFVDVTADAIAVEDQFSSATVVVIVAVE